jgi:hypothetical protein
MLAAPPIRCSASDNRRHAVARHASDVTRPDEHDHARLDTEDVDDRAASIPGRVTLAPAEQLAAHARGNQAPHRRASGRVARDLGQHVVLDRHGVADLR